MYLHQQHPDRSAIHAEAHARPPVAIESERAEAWHWVLHDYGSDEQWPKGFDVDARHQLIERPDGILRFEIHTEFASLTFFGEKAPSQETLDLISQCPGRQLAGARVIVSEKNTLPEPLREGRLFGGEAMFEGIIVSTDFQIREDGLVIYAVSGSFEDSYGRGRLVKHLLDLETYRMASLLGLPLVRRHTPQLQDLEKRAEASVRALAGNPDDLNVAIQELARLLKEISALRGEVKYRIAASAAYDDLVVGRLESLEEKPLGQRQTLKGFVEHRLAPGIKSVRAFERRTDEVAKSVTGALALVRTQLDHAAQQQSQALLESMEQRARQQVHLAQAVEGLSVAAITYYTVGLLAYALKGAPDFGISDSVLVALSIIPIGVLVAIVTRQARNRISKIAK